ncbi:Cytochrome P450 monooxygenase sdnE [Fusarium oxysporum f. sp. albedinis]|nr:Cytochrome P450 monooxygenase sdnE [Fusarium oxysporum f. sp. albedinis]
MYLELILLTHFKPSRVNYCQGIKLAARNGLHFPYCNIILVSKRGVKPLTDRLIKESSRQAISPHSGPHLDTLTLSYSCVSNNNIPVCCCLLCKGS